MVEAVLLDEYGLSNSDLETLRKEIIEGIQSFLEELDPVEEKEKREACEILETIETYMRLIKQGSLSLIHRRTERDPFAHRQNTIYLETQGKLISYLKQIGIIGSDLEFVENCGPEIFERQMMGPNEDQAA